MTEFRICSFILVAIGALGLTSCNKGPALIEGDKLNEYFPKSGGNHKVVITTKQNGFAQASLRSGEEEVATISVTDLVRDEDSVKKFEGAPKKIVGYPVISPGDDGTAVLVGRFQIQARSKIDEFTAEERIKWLEKFDLAGLAKIRES